MSTDKEIAIQVTNLSKMYKVYSRPSDLFWEIFRGKPLFKPFWALKNISFDIKKGQVVGVIGPNGSGKSTLLRILSGTLDKTEGDIKIDGRISAILELGTGFNPEYNGRENIRLGCIYLGMTPNQVDEKMEWIIRFSELGDFIDQPLKTYSSGMQARLTFATAVSIDPDIFIVDEALAAGDAYFVNKSLSRIRQICKSGSTVLFVSHSTGVITSLCDKVIWLENGTIHQMGKTQPIVRAYEYEIHKKLSFDLGRIETIDVGISSADDDMKNHDSMDKIFESQDQLSQQNTEFREEESLPSLIDERNVENGLSSPYKKEINPDIFYPDSQPIFVKGPVFIDRVQFINSDSEEVRTFTRWSKMTIRVWYHVEGDLPEDTLGLALGIHRKSDLLRISHFSTMWMAKDTDFISYESAEYRKKPGRTGRIECTIDPIQLAEGDYLVSVGLASNNPLVADFYEQRYEAYSINIIRDGHELNGLVYYPIVQWAHEIDVKEEPLNKE